MIFYKLIVAYDGSDYFGWQVQKEKPSIAQALNEAFFKVFKKEIKVLGASRTDAGVHAWGQVVRIATDLSIAPETLRWAWNNALSSAIMIRSLEIVDKKFNPFCNVVQKVYYYHFYLERPVPFMRNYGYFHPYKVDLSILQQALQCFVGTHDFASFRSSEDTRLETIRTIDYIDCKYLKRYNVYRITIKGKKFLRHMIRRIVGASLSISSLPHKDIDMLKKIMEAKDPGHILMNAPAKGLMLYKIFYT